MSKAALSVSPRSPRRARLRDAVFTRDKGICQLCKINLADMHERLLALRKDSRGSRFLSEGFRDLLKRIGVGADLKLYEIDHVQPLCEGGEDSARNARLLCQWCHARQTKELAARRARRPQRRKP